MSNDYLSQIGELEQEFTQELKGYGSLSPHLVGEAADDREYLGFDIRPEDVEALYFEGIGIPRWETIKADTVEQQVALYNEAMQEIMAAYPLIGRVSDTDQKVAFTPEEVSRLRRECDEVLENASNPQAVKALQKVALVCYRAAEQNKGLLLLPS